jgi:hypothetical protein
MINTSFKQQRNKKLTSNLNSKIILFLLLFLLFQVFMVYLIHKTYGEISAVAILLVFIAMNYWIVIEAKNAIKKIDPMLEIVSYLPLVIVSAPLIVNSVILVLFYEPSFQAQKYIVGEVSDWIVFFGSLTGGLITMLAVYFTLKSNSKDREILRKESELKWKEEKASLYLPIFEIDKFFSGLNVFILNIVPVNNNTMRDFVLFEQNYGGNNPIENLFVLEELPIISGNNHRKIIFTLSPNYIPKKMRSSRFDSSFTFQYYDVLRIKKYQHRIEFILDIEIDNNGNVSSYIVDNNIKNYPLVESSFVE